MSESNSFLSNYNKGVEENTAPSYQYEPKKDTPGRKIPKLLIPVIAGGVIVLAIVITLVLVFNRGIEIIDLTGWTLSDAQLWANENGILLQTQEEYNDTYEEGEVFGQDIPAGTAIRKGDFLQLTVSLGHDLSVTLPLPDLKSMTMEEVEEWADNNYMTKVRITTEYSDTVASGQVIRF